MASGLSFSYFSHQSAYELQFKSPWMDLNLHQMPKFGWPESFIIQVNLPRPTEDAAEMRLDPTEDVKISLTFSKHKLVVPWTLLYDSKHKKSLLKLIVTFSHDDFDVISLKSESICKSSPFP